MSPIRSYLPAAGLIALLFIGLPRPASGQHLDYLSLDDSTLAIVRDMPEEDLQTELDAISELLSSYERSKRDADHLRKLVEKSIDGIEKEIDIVKTKIELAKKEERSADRDSLESEKNALETKKDYYEKASDLRERERRHAEALIDWTKRVRTYFEKGLQLMEERKREDRRSDDLLTLERELIKEQKEAADRLKRVADEMSRVADRREDLYKRRQELLKPDK